MTVNAIAPGALTRLTEDLGLPEEMLPRFDPKWVAPLCVWLASPLSKDCTEQVIEASGMVFAVAEGWHQRPSVDPVLDPNQLDASMRTLLAQARRDATMQNRT